MKSLVVWGEGGGTGAEVVWGEGAVEGEGGLNMSRIVSGLSGAGVLAEVGSRKAVLTTESGRF